MLRVMVTHADEPLGRRIVKTLFHDARVEFVLGVGCGAAPRSFDRFLADPAGRFGYVRSQLSRHRAVSDLFGSTRVREARLDSVVHVPAHQRASVGAARSLGGLPPRTAEARHLVQYCAETAGIRSLVALGSAFVYQLPPGNANRLREGNPLDLAPDAPPELRSWVDCDMIFQAELGNPHLRVVLLRVPTVVESGGFLYLHPSLEGRAGPRLRPLGFDPVCALIADKDVARAVAAALRAEHGGVYNVAGVESVPLSVLGRWTNRPCIPVPGPLLRMAAGALRRAAGEERARSLSGTHLHYGFTLDTARAERELDFRPAYRVGVGRAGDGEMRLETAAI